MSYQSKKRSEEGSLLTTATFGPGEGTRNGLSRVIHWALDAAGYSENITPPTREHTRIHRHLVLSTENAQIPTDPTPVIFIREPSKKNESVTGVE